MPLSLPQDSGSQTVTSSLHANSTGGEGSPATFVVPPSEGGFHHIRQAGQVVRSGRHIARRSDGAWLLPARQIAKSRLAQQRCKREDASNPHIQQHATDAVREKQNTVHLSEPSEWTTRWSAKQKIDQPQQLSLLQEPWAWSFTSDIDCQTFPGLCRLKDGLFLSSPCVANDEGFLDSNKVTHVVAIETVVVIENSSRLPPFSDVTHEPLNRAECDGHRRKLDLNWPLTEEARDPLLLEKRLKDLVRIIAFIDEASEEGGSCLLYSSDGLHSAAAAASAYFLVKGPCANCLRRQKAINRSRMKPFPRRSISYTAIYTMLHFWFRWSLAFCIEFLSTRRVRLQLRPELIALLQSAEKQRYLAAVPKLLSNDVAASPGTDAEGSLLQNTFINSTLANRTQGQVHTVRKTRSVGHELRWRTPLDVYQQCRKLPAVPRNTKVEFSRRQSAESGEAPRSILKKTHTRTTFIKGLVSKQGPKCARTMLQLPASSERSRVQQRPPIAEAANISHPVLPKSDAHAQAQGGDSSASTPRQCGAQKINLTVPSFTSNGNELDFAQLRLPRGPEDVASITSLKLRPEGCAGQPEKSHFVQSLSRQSSASARHKSALAMFCGCGFSWRHERRSGNTGSVNYNSPPDGVKLTSEIKFNLANSIPTLSVHLV